MTVTTLMDREVQTSDTLVYRKDLPKEGYISAIDIGVRFTNGATVPQNKDPLDIFNHISLLFNGTDYKYHLKGRDAHYYNWSREGKPMPCYFTEVASATQEVWFRIPLGRFIGDKEYGLDLSKFRNVQLQLDYALSNFGTVGTHIITGTIAFTVLLHEFVYPQRPSFKGLIAAREFWTGTSVASRTTQEYLPAQNPMTALYLSAAEAAIADGTDITDIKIGKDRFATVWADGKWYNFARFFNDKLKVRYEDWILTYAAAATKRVHANTIRFTTLTNEDYHVK
jgi:hypothetical protein